jgi:hypothetical protein
LSLLKLRLPFLKHLLLFGYLRLECFDLFSKGGNTLLVVVLLVLTLFNSLLFRFLSPFEIIHKHIKRVLLLLELCKL